MIKKNQKVLCTVAMTQFYESGKLYDLYSDGKTEYVKGSDGMYDEVRKTLSKFRKVENE